MGKPIEQPKLPVPNTSRIHDKIIPILDCTIPHARSRDDSGSRMVNRKSTQDVNREIPTDPDPTYRPPPIPVKLSMPEVP